jgi:protein SCO1/2
VQGIFVTIDPERDTPEMLRNYMQSFDPGYVALVPNAQQLEQAAKDFKVYYKKAAGKTPTSYTMEHTAASFVFDPQGRIRLFTRYGLGAQALADDLKLLLS